MTMRHRPGSPVVIQFLRGMARRSSRPTARHGRIVVPAAPGIRRLVPLLVLLALTGPVSQAQAATLDVPSNDYPTIDSAVDHAADGDTILIQPGTYIQYGQIVIDKRLTFASLYESTQQEQYINQTIVDGNDVDQLFFQNPGSGLVRFVGITITNANKAIVANDEIEVSHCVLTGNDADALSFEFSGYGYCGYSILENSSDDGIDIDARTGPFVIEHNLIRNNGDDGIEIRLYSHSGPQIEYQITDNIFSGNDEDGLQLIDYDGHHPRVFYVAHNVFADNAMVGLGCTADGNTVEDYNGSAMEEVVYVINNTFVGNHYGLTGGANMTVLNCIFADNSSTGVSHVSGSSIVDVALFHGNGTDIADSVIGSNFLYEPPVYDSAFYLQEGSPCIARGVAHYEWLSQVVLDLQAGEYQGTAPDLGAYEYDPDGPGPDPETNQPPVVDAGDDLVIFGPTISAIMNATVTDDGLPEGSHVTLSWSKDDGPGDVVFSDQHVEDPTVTFSRQGRYVLELLATDGDATALDRIEVRYVQGGDGHTTPLNETPTTCFEAEDYAWLIAPGQVITDPLASGGRAVEVAPDAQELGYAEYLVVMTQDQAHYSIWVRLHSSQSSHSAFVSFDSSAATEIPVSADDGYTWVAMPGGVTTTAGRWSLVVGSSDPGLRWDKICISTDNSYVPTDDGSGDSTEPGSGCGCAMDGGPATEQVPLWIFMLCVLVLLRRTRG